MKSFDTQSAPVNPRILVFADASSPEVAGWVSAAISQGAQVVVFTRQPAQLPGAQVLALSPLSHAGGWFAALRQMRRVVGQVAREFKPNLVHSHGITTYGLWGMACGLSLPRVLTALDAEALDAHRLGPLQRWLMTRAMYQARVVTAASLQAIDSLRRHGPQVRVVQMLSGVDTGFFQPGQPAADFEMVSLRPSQPSDNNDAVIDAFVRFLTLRPHSHACLHLWGGGAMTQALQDRVTSLRLLQQVRFHGDLDQAALRDLFQRCRLAVSVQQAEAVSGPVLQAMSCALPLVVSDVRDNSQWLDERGGWLVPVRDIDALASAMVEAHDQVANSQAKGQHNRQRVLAEAARQDRVDLIWQMYLRVLGQSPQA